MRILCLVLSLTLISCATYQGRVNRPEKWAKPIQLDGVANMYKVNDNLYRSAQPTAKGFSNLEEFGVKTVINLRTFGEIEENETVGNSIKKVSIPMLSWAPNDIQNDQFLSLLSDSAGAPYLVHCYHGSDRTGSQVALYRVAAQNWEVDEAIEEMKYGGYGFHKIWQNLIIWVRQKGSDVQDETSVEAIK